MRVSDSDEEELNNYIIDQLLRAVADRQSPGNITPFSFNSFANAAKRKGELLLGARGSVERRRHASTYGKYRKQAARGKTSLDVDPDYSFFSPDGPLDKSDELVILLNPNSSHTNSPLRSQHNSPLRSPHNSPLRPNRNQRKSTSTMSDKQPKKEEPSLWEVLVKNVTNHAISFTDASINPDGTMGYQLDVKDGKLHTKKGGILFASGSFTEAECMDPCIVGDGTAIRLAKPLLPALVNGIRTYGGTKANDSILEKAMTDSLNADKERDRVIDVYLGGLNPEERSSIFFKDVDYPGGTIKNVPFRYHYYHLPPGMFASNARFNPISKDLVGEPLDSNVVFMNDLPSMDPRKIIQDLVKAAPNTSSMAYTGLSDDEKLQKYLPAAKLFLEDLMKVKCAYFMSIEFEIEGQKRGGLNLGNQNNRSLSDMVQNLHL